MIIFQKMLLFVTAFLVAGASAYRDLEFLYPDGTISTPTTANTTTHKITHKYEEELFKTHLQALSNIQVFINNSQLFVDNETNFPLPIIANTIHNTINLIKRDLNDLKYVFDRKTIGKTRATDNTTIVFDTLSWFQGLRLAETKGISELLMVIGAYPLSNETSSNTRIQGIEQATLIQSTIAVYHQELNNYQNFVTNIRNMDLNGKSETILIDHLQPYHEGSHLGHIEITHMSASSTGLEFEVTVTALTDVKEYITYTNIPYAGYQVKGDYFASSSRSHIFQITCQHGYCLEQPANPCTEALHRGSHLEVLQNCLLERNDHPFKTTNAGIFIFTEPLHDIKDLLNDHDLDVESWPAFVTFTGCYELQHLNVKFSGCLNLNDNVHLSKVDTKLVQDFIDTTFAEKVSEYVTNIPMMIALILLPAGTIGMLCLLKAIYIKCCKTTPPTRPNKQNMVPLLPTPSKPIVKPNTTKKTAINLD